MLNDQIMNYFLRSLKLRSKELSCGEAVKHAATLQRFFAVELNYKGAPVRLIIAASDVPKELQPGNSDRDAQALTSSVEEIQTVRENAKGNFVSDTQQPTSAAGETVAPAVTNRG